MATALHILVHIILPLFALIGVGVLLDRIFKLGRPLLGAKKQLPQFGFGECRAAYGCDEPAKTNYGSSSKGIATDRPAVCG